MSNPFPFEGAWRGSTPPDYVSVFAWRQRQITLLRSDPFMMAGALEYYRTRPVEFIEHWCDTYDPRLAGTDRPAKMPFILFPRQKEFINFIFEGLRTENNMLIEKCRDVGATWLAGAASFHLWRFLPGAAVGWGSRKQDLVDKLGDPDSIFEKIRILITGVPSDFWPIGFNPQLHMPFMRIVNPETGSTITGESGDNIGRGGRKLIYFKDESAHYERPEKIEAALADNTRVQVDISSVNGLGNVYHRRRKSGIDWTPGTPMIKGRTSVFVFDWRSHPEKDDAWYQTRRQKAADEGLLHIFAQEVERNYAASVEGVIINPAWIAAAVDAHLKLKFDDEGPCIAALDVADEGNDRNALALRKGPILKYAEAWGEGDTGYTARKAVSKVRDMRHLPCRLQYDSVGVGAGVKAETNRLTLEKIMPDGIVMVPWNAGAGPLFPEQRMIRGDSKSMLNKDYFSGLKAQGWFQLARRFERTWRAIHEGRQYDPGELISIPSTLPCLPQLEQELAQVTQSQSTKTLKMLINKAPEGTMSPNLADAVMMAYWPMTAGVSYTTGNIG